MNCPAAVCAMHDSRCVAGVGEGLCLIGYRLRPVASSRIVIPSIFISLRLLQLPLGREDPIMSRWRWIRSLCLWMLPAIVLCVGATSFGAITFSNNTLTYSSTSDLSTTIDPPGQKDVTDSYGIAKASFQALSPQVVAFNGAPAPSPTLRTLVANYDAGNTVTFTFPAAMYNYGSYTSVGRGSFSGSAAQDAISTVPVLNGGLYDWFDATITSTGDKGVRALGFCVAFRTDQVVAAGQVLYTLSDATTETITLPALGGPGNPEYVFIGYQAPAGKTITRVQASRTRRAWRRLCVYRRPGVRDERQCS